jgi:hypothetical protein
MSYLVNSSLTLPGYGTYGYPEQQPFAGQGVQGGNLRYQAAVSAETPQLPQRIQPPYQIYDVGQQLLYQQISLQQYCTPSDLANSIPTTQTPLVTSQYEHFPPQTLARRSPLQQPHNVEMDYSLMGPKNNQEQQQIMLSSDNMDEAYNRYQQRLKTAFEAISANRLVDASLEIMDLSRWLLTNVTKLGELLSTLLAG